MRSKITGTAVGFATHFANPFEETENADAFTPHEAEKLAGSEIRGSGTEKSFHAPLQVRAFPWAEAIAFRREPIVA